MYKMTLYIPLFIIHLVAATSGTMQISTGNQRN